MFGYGIPRNGHQPEDLGVTPLSCLLLLESQQKIIQIITNFRGWGWQFRGGWPEIFWRFRGCGSSWFWKIPSTPTPPEVQTPNPKEPRVSGTARIYWEVDLCATSSRCWWMRRQYLHIYYKYWSIFSFLTWPSPSFQNIIDDPAKISGENKMTLPYFSGSYLLSIILFWM